MSTLAEKLEYLAGTKEAIKQSLIDRGCTISDSDTFRSYVNKLSELPSLPISITAVYTQTTTVTDTDSLDVLRPDLVVTAYYGDGTTKVVTDYTLSGTLEVGTSTITASYKGLSDSFDVTVEESIHYLYKWDFTQSLTDSVQGQVAILRNGLSRDNRGLVFDAENEICTLGSNIPMSDRTIEIDVADFDFKGATSDAIRFLMCDVSNDWWGISGLYYNTSVGVSINRWGTYGYDRYNQTRAGSGSRFIEFTPTIADKNIINGKTVKVVFGGENNSTTQLYLNDVLVGISTGNYFPPNLTKNLEIGGEFMASSGNTCYDMTITGVRIYANQ